jgi:hypothetical protein
VFLTVVDLLMDKELAEIRHTVPAPQSSNVLGGDQTKLVS